MIRFQKHILLLFILLICSSLSYGQFYNGMNDEFGKNRVQYKEFLWSFYKYKKYDVYFYRGGQELAEFTAKAAEKHVKELEQLFEFQLESKFQFIVYNNKSDFYQSNIGNLSNDQNVGGKTRLVGSKVFLYFDGKHEDLEIAIREGVAKVIINQVIFGGDLRESLKNNALMSLPHWFEAGLVSYLANPNNHKVNYTIKDGVINERFAKFNRIEGYDLVAVGHSIWDFVVRNYGIGDLPNILYMTKVSRSAESGFLFVLGISSNNLIDKWYLSLREEYKDQNLENDFVNQESLLKKFKKNRVYYQYEINPQGTKVAYVTNEMHQYKIWIKDLETGKVKKIDRKNGKLDISVDLSIPLLEWHPNGAFLSVITEEKAKFWWKLYEVKTKEWTESEIFQFDKIMDYAYSPDGKYFVMSAFRRGKTDLYKFGVQSRRIEQLTNDFYDELNPIFVGGQSKILFTSNRTNDSLSIGGKENKVYDYQYDLFLWDQSSPEVLKRITDTPNVNEMTPQNYAKNTFAYVGEEGMIRNLYVGKFDSIITHVDTIAHYSYQSETFAISNRVNSLLEYTSSKDLLLEVAYLDGRYKVGTKAKLPFDSLTSVVVSLPKRGSVGVLHAKDYPVFYVDTTVTEKPEIDIDDYQFEADEDEGKKDVVVFTLKDEQGENETSILPKEEKLKVDSIAKKYQRHVFSKARNYDVAFQPDYLVTQFDKAYLNPMYQRFTGGAFYANPGLNTFFKLGTTDILEDYKVIAGARYGGSLDNEFIVIFENDKKRLDKGFVYNRLVQADASNDIALKQVSNIFTFKLKIPLSMTQRFTVSPSVRLDEDIALNTGPVGLTSPESYALWSRLKLDYVYDNTRNRGLNLRHGTRLKLFAEGFYEFESENPTMFVFGADIRNYTKVHKQIIWASRLAWSSSMGDQKLLYYLGGVDNWLFPKFNNNMQISQTQNYAYQSIGTNMRGFQQNIRNGNSFVTLNTEIRWPIFQYFVSKPLKNEFFKQCQLVGFGDVGTAWTGMNPYSKDNNLNIETLGSSPLVVTLRSQQEPFVGGIGYGLRTKLWGYFVRADWAWGIEEGRMNDKSRFYISLNLDF